MTLQFAKCCKSVFMLISDFVNFANAYLASVIS